MPRPSIPSPYRLHWCVAAPIPNELARVVDTRTGMGAAPGSRMFLLQLRRPSPQGSSGRREIAARGDERPRQVVHPTVAINPQLETWRGVFELLPSDAKQIELRARLMGERGQVSETWLYRWTA